MHCLHDSRIVVLEFWHEVGCLFDIVFDLVGYVVEGLIVLRVRVLKCVDGLLTSFDEGFWHFVGVVNLVYEESGAYGADDRGAF
jgi:hypothetical protein